jgi:exopolysaccharide biosynthesis polyprenyl glycosylphosphotransferase
MKRTELVVSAILVPIDFVMLILAAWMAHRARFLALVEDIRPVLYDIAFISYLQSAALVAALWVIIFALSGLYNRKTTDSWFDEIGRIIVACSAGLILVVMIIFFQRELFSSRFIILLAYALAILFVACAHIVVRGFARQIFKHGYGAHRVAIVGESAESERLSQVLESRPELGYRLVARLPVSKQGLGELQQLAEKDEVDEVHFVEPTADRYLRILFYEKAERYHLAFRYTPDLLTSPIGNPSVELDAGVPLVEVPETKLVGWNKVQKRLFDIVVSSLGMIVLFPIFLIIGFAVALESGLPILYKSERVGQGRRFYMFKFRSMRPEFCVGEKYGGQSAMYLHEKLTKEQSGRSGIIPKVERDPRITDIGKWLRRYSLDELPQLWNVLSGDMSLVGPRPHMPIEVSNYSEHHHKVFAIKPGITGLSQVNGRSDIDFEEEVKLDRYYIEQWNFWLDLRIIIRTIPTILRPPKQES